MRIRTLNDEDNPDLYVGSGQNVHGNNSGRQSNNPLVQDLLQGAEQRQVNESQGVVREFIIYRNGFLLHKTFFTHDSEQGKIVLKSLKSGHAPLAILDVEQNQEVELKASQKLEEDYVPPFEAFTGTGNRLGAPVAVASSTPEEHPGLTSELDPNDPNNMTLQIRRSDGSRSTFVCPRSSTVNQVNSQLHGTLFHTFPRKQVASLSGCEKEVLLLI
eukprot:NODE_216_length_14242_cov_0.417592.p10 type:complete len:216 gc:universal NODE_216_length_14242_cov_0.417592:8103-7456(-)